MTQSEAQKYKSILRRIRRAIEAWSLLLLVAIPWGIGVVQITKWVIQ
jgi:hypothetical protein